MLTKCVFDYRFYISAKVADCTFIHEFWEKRQCPVAVKNLVGEGGGEGARRKYGEERKRHNVITVNSRRSERKTTCRAYSRSGVKR